MSADATGKHVQVETRFPWHKRSLSTVLIIRRKRRSSTPQHRDYHVGWCLLGPPLSRPRSGDDDREVCAHLALKLHAVAAFEGQDFARLVGAGDFEAEPLDDLAHLRDLLGVGLG